MSERCSGAALARGDQVAGSATQVPAFLLVEAAVPWGEVALRDSRLPPAAKGWLRAEAAATRVRVLLIRRPGRSAPRTTRVFAVRTGEWCESTELDRVEDVTSLDIPGLGQGRSPGLTPWPEPVVLVCTHGRHDACCAERGRPLAAAMSALRPDAVWECSHLGGDRFAGNVLVLPDGLGYGQVTEDAVPRLVDDLDHGRVTLDLMRGRATLPMAAQFAEVELRRALGEIRNDAVRCLSVSRQGDLTTARFEAAGEVHEVTVRSTAGPPALLTCGARRENPVPRHEVVASARV
jgi:hypothetical protein